jgi:hypothetical protein
VIKLQNKREKSRSPEIDRPHLASDFIKQMLGTKQRAPDGLFKVAGLKSTQHFAQDMQRHGISKEIIDEKPVRHQRNFLP